jgi:hypothetical protein
MLDMHGLTVTISRLDAQDEVTGYGETYPRG